MRFWRASVFTVLLPFSSLWAQPAIDSLHNLADSQTGTRKIDALNVLSLRLMLLDYTLAEGPIEQALMLSEKSQYKEGLAEASINKGICQDIRGNRQASLHLLTRALQVAREGGDRTTEGSALTQIASVYRGDGNYDSAKYWYDQAYEVLKDYPETWQMSVLYRNLGLYSYLVNKFEAEVDYLNHALRIRQKLSDKILMMDILILLAQAHLRQFNIPLAETYLNEAQKYCGSGTSTAAQKEINYQKAIISFRKNNYREALVQFADAKDFYLKHGNLQQYASLLIDLAEALEEMSSHELSLKNAFEALKVCEENKLLMNSVRAQIIIGKNYTRLNQQSLAHEFANQALATAHANNFVFLEGAAYNLNGLALQSEGKLKEALIAYEKAYSLRNSVADKGGMSASLSNIGEVYEELNQFGKSLEFQSQAEKLAKAVPSHLTLCWVYFNTGKIYFRQKKFKQAEYYLAKAEAKAHQIKYPLALVYIYPIRRDLLAEQGRLMQALNYSLSYEQLKDSVNSISIATRVLGLQSLYDMERKDHEIVLLNKNKEVQQQQIENQKLRIRSQEYVLGLGILALILTGAWAYTANRSSKKMVLLNTEIKERNEEIQSQSEELRESNEMISHLNEGLEQKVLDRTKQLQQAYKELDTFFYRSSHDFRRPLTTFMGLAEVAKVTVKDAGALDLFEKVKETAINLDRMLIKLQSISDVGAQQFVYKELSLKQVFESTLDTYREALSQKKIKTTIQVMPIASFSSYPAFLKIIVDNLVENSIQFSGRTSPYIKLMAQEKNHGVTIIVEDNGIGVEEEYKGQLFDMFFRGNEHSKGNGLGLYIVQKAVEKLNASLTFESVLGRGTVFTIWFPRSQPEKH